MIPKTLYAIIGHPLGHTLSPLLHNWGFELHGLDSVYLAFPTKPEKLGDFMAAMRTLPISGASVTIPHKRAVAQYLDQRTYRAKMVGAVNTLFWKEGELWGENTDVAGIVQPIASLERKVDRAMVLGAGGAARAAVAGLRELGVKEILVCNRTLFKAETLAHDLQVRVLDWEKRESFKGDLIINSTPLGMSGDWETMSPLPGGGPAQETAVFDLVYNPLRTKLLTEASKQGCTVISGLEMFAAQGMAQFELWTGRTLEPGLVRDLLLDALSEPGEG